MPATPTSRAAPGALALYGALLLSAAWGTLAPFVGPALDIDLDSDLPARVADHAIPGVLAIVFGLAAGLAERNGSPRAGALTGVALLAGVWMTGAHLPLIPQALDGEASWMATIFHTAPGVLVVVCCAMLLARSVVIARLGRDGHV